MATGEAFGAVSGIMSTIIGNEMANSNNTQAAITNYRYGEAAANNADKRTRALYEDLYSPEAKLKQLQSAGLSPALMYANGAGVMGSGQAGAQGQGAGNQQGKMPIMDIAGAMLSGSQIELAESQARKNNAEAKVIENKGEAQADADIAEKLAQAGLAKSGQALNDVETELKQIEVYIKDTTKEFDIEKASANAQKAWADALYSYHHADREKVQLAIDEKTAESKVQEQFEKVANIMADTLLKQAQRELSEAEKQQVYKTIWKIQQDVTIAQGNLEQYKRHVSVEEIKNDLQKDMIELQRELGIKQIDAQYWQMGAQLIGTAAVTASMLLGANTTGTLLGKLIGSKVTSKIGFAQ